MSRSGSFISPLHQKEYISVKVENPMIHNTHDEGRYTTYEISLQTNSPSFALKSSIVERRYSDFVWLRRTLARTTDVKPPTLPFGRIFGLFTSSFLQERQKILTEFIMLVVQETQFLSNTALHLFLQTNLKRQQMDSILKDARRRGSMDSISRAVSLYGAVRPTKPIKLSSSSSNLSDPALSRPIPYSSSAPVFGPAHATPARASERLRQISENAAMMTCDVGSSLSSSVGSSQGLPRDNNNPLKEGDDWVVLDPQEDDVITHDVTENAYTKVTWKVGGGSGPGTPHKRQSPKWDERHMTKFLTSAGAVADSESRRLESPSATDANFVDETLKNELVETLRREGSVHRSSSQNNASKNALKAETLPCEASSTVSVDIQVDQAIETVPDRDSDSFQETKKPETPQSAEDATEQSKKKNTVPKEVEPKVEPVQDQAATRAASPPIPIVQKPFLATSGRSRSADDVATARSDPKAREHSRRSFGDSSSNIGGQLFTSSLDSGVGASDDDQPKPCPS